MVKNQLNDAVQATVETLEPVVTGIFISTIVLNQLAASAVGDAEMLLMSFIEDFSLIIHLPLTKCNFPISVQVYFSYMLPFVMFDVLDKLEDYQLDTESILQLQDASNDDIVPQISELGYQSRNVIVNLGSLWIFMVIYLCKVAFFGLAYLFTLGKSCGYFKKSIQNTFFNDLIGLTLEGYLDMLVVCFFHFTAPT